MLGRWTDALIERTRTILGSMTAGIGIAAVLVIVTPVLAAQYMVTDLGTLGGDISIAYAINDSGQIVGVAGTATPHTSHAFIYDGTMHDLLGAAGGASSVATAINGSGEVAGYNATTIFSANRAFFYDGTLHDLGNLVGNGSEANGINDSGIVAGTYIWNKNTAETHAFLYDGTVHDPGVYNAARRPSTTVARSWASSMW